MRRILYIISPGHSGSTLLTLLLATHPEIATIGERRYLMTRLLKRDRDAPLNHCLCGTPVPDCDYLRSLYERGRRRLPWFLRDTNYPYFHYSGNHRINRLVRRVQKRVNRGPAPAIVSKLVSIPTEQLLRANLAVIDGVLELENGSMFVDGSKSTVDINHMTPSDENEVTLIHLSRDGRGQFHSMLRNNRHLSEEEAARLFSRWHSRIQQLVDRWEGKIIRVRYEDLCEQPLGELRRIAGEAGLDPRGLSLDFRSGARHAIGNSKLMLSDSTSIVDKQAWKTELTEDQLATFERIAGDANRSFGYTT